MSHRNKKTGPWAPFCSIHPATAGAMSDQHNIVLLLPDIWLGMQRNRLANEIR